MFDAITAEAQYRQQEIRRDWRRGEPVLRRILRSLRAPSVRPSRVPRVAVGPVAGA